jgi:hypothetical protein
VTERPAIENLEEVAAAAVAGRELNSRSGLLQVGHRSMGLYVLLGDPEEIEAFAREIQDALVKFNKWAPELEGEREEETAELVWLGVDDGRDDTVRVRLHGRLDAEFEGNLANPLSGRGRIAAAVH